MSCECSSDAWLSRAFNRSAGRPRRVRSRLMRQTVVWPAALRSVLEGFTVVAPHGSRGVAESFEESTMIATPAVRRLTMRSVPRTLPSCPSCEIGRPIASRPKDSTRLGRYASCMAQERSVARARNGRPLVATVAVPAALIAVLIAVAAVLLASGGGQRAANKELDARAANVKESWDAAGRPGGGSQLRRLGVRMNAQLRVVRGRHPQAGTTSGDVRNYAFATRERRTLRVALSAKASADAVSAGRLAAIFVGLAGALLLGVLLSAILRGAAVGPLRGLAGALAQLKGGAPDARAPISGAREVRAAA